MWRTPPPPTPRYRVSMAGTFSRSIPLIPPAIDPPKIPRPCANPPPPPPREGGWVGGSEAGTIFGVPQTILQFPLFKIKSEDNFAVVGRLGFAPPPPPTGGGSQSTRLIGPGIHPHASAFFPFPRSSVYTCASRLPHGRRKRGLRWGGGGGRLSPQKEKGGGCLEKGLQRQSPEIKTVHWLGNWAALWPGGKMF